MSSQTVLITGLNGFTAPHIAHQFLSNGWNVRGTVRSTSKKEAVLNLPSLKEWAAKGKLEIVIVEDFLTSDWSEALNGADAVVLAASPFNMTLKTYEEFAHPAVKGTTRILEAAAKVSSIKSIAYVSSTVAVMNYLTPAATHEGKIYTEKDWLPWTEEDAKKEDFSAAHWYCISKKYAGRAARETKERTGATWALSSYCSPGIYGPVEHINDIKEIKNLTPGSDLSTSSLYRALCGGEKSPISPEYHVQYVDVNLAAAIYSGVNKKSNGRFLTAGDFWTFQKFANIARQLRPDLSKFIVKGNPEGRVDPEEGSYRLDASASEKELGITYRKLEDTVRDTIARFEELGAYKDN
ncbi:uncharacterized protein L201_001728 [Kwoniella dendrophila CBS 6074]|uniref:NAD-dependent epimerase/dehydratase domain-containing protein n=1 Tax=Kwoniella dendrophila CBS 6074 TaxID=1295534 RepID=A0AAX4JNA4_9TREE